MLKYLNLNRKKSSASPSTFYHRCDNIVIVEIECPSYTTNIFNKQTLLSDDVKILIQTWVFFFVLLFHDFFSHMEKSIFDGDFKYQFGIGNYFFSEAIVEALTVGQNIPLICYFGLYVEQLSNIFFTTCHSSFSLYF